MHNGGTTAHGLAASELDASELAAVSGGESPIGYSIGYAAGYLLRLIVEWEPAGVEPFGGLA